jgi:hypothetical protein
MGATRRNLQPTQNLKNNDRNTKYTNQNKKKYVSYLKSVKEPKIRMRATRRNLQAQPKILKNDWNTKSTNRKDIFPKKKYV